jgi:hypothetical protein
MYVAAAVLIVPSGLFYAAGHHEIGSVGVAMPLRRCVLR